MLKDKKSCQVIGCQAQLPTGRVYHTRYRICPYHAGLPEMILAGKIVRFCQQCGRFQPIADFEGMKKSCVNKLQMHNAQRKRAREKNQAAIKRRPTPRLSRKFTPSPTSSLSHEPETPTKSKVNVSLEIGLAVNGVNTPVKHEASPVLNEVLLATAAKAVLEPAAPVAETTATAATPLPAVAAGDGYEMAPLTLKEVDTLMEEFNSPFARELSLSILEEEEERQQQQQRRGRQRCSPEAMSTEVLAPIVTIEPLPPAVVFNSAPSNTCSPFIQRTPGQLSQLQLPIATAATAIAPAAASPLMNGGIAVDGSWNLYDVPPFKKSDTLNVRAYNLAACSITEERSLESEVVSASFRLFSVPPALLPLPILEHLKSLLKVAKV
ncbi:hypothetical protein Ndes2526B_g07671 [Nannochloris sp. 'desiccata']|nr:putative Squamosa promoter-binding protein 1 [Chlorella desiccata (nom. nud.)]